MSPLRWIGQGFFPDTVCAALSERADGFNLATHVGDDLAAVQKRRRWWSEQLQARPVWLKQVHGHSVLPLPVSQHDGLSCTGTAACTDDFFEADAAVCFEPGWACTVMVADCLPVLLARADGQGVGAAHAGWRGLSSGVLERTVEALRRDRGDPALMAWLGPCIGPTAFEVGEDVRATDPDAQAFFRPIPGKKGKWWCDLAAWARHRLSRQGGVLVHNMGACTYSDPVAWFSHRRADRPAGRMAASIAIRAPSARV